VSCKYVGTGFSAPTSIAIVGSKAWVTNYNDRAVAVCTVSGSNLTDCVNSGGFNSPSSIAFVDLAPINNYCAPGTYAEGTNTGDCSPCPVNSYQDSYGATTCKPCPSKSYAHLPGAAACMKCIGGRATACTATSCTATAPSSGYAVATVSSLGQLASCPAWNGAADAAFGPRPSLFTTCSVSQGAVLSFFVKATCEVVISPLATAALTSTTGLACSAPGNADGTVTGFYTAVDTIMSKLSSE
jgi:hypothetical protein